jgi:hypothetical protein
MDRGHFTRLAPWSTQKTLGDLRISDFQHLSCSLLCTENWAENPCRTSAVHIAEVVFGLGVHFWLETDILLRLFDLNHPHSPIAEQSLKTLRARNDTLNIAARNMVEFCR